MKKIMQVLKFMENGSAIAVAIGMAFLVGADHTPGASSVEGVETIGILLNITAMAMVVFMISWVSLVACRLISKEET